MATPTHDLDIPAPLTLDGDALDPIGGGGALIGYGRVSTKDQNLDRQIHALTAAGCQKIYTDKKSGKDTERVGPRVPGCHQPDLGAWSPATTRLSSCATMCRGTPGRTADRLGLLARGTGRPLMAAGARGNRPRPRIRV
ncbi:recombinase family protein [Nocardia sp. NBC_00403]|uniref:recombinase family protein n=1 Tax=Nocardia sp. NBC_00403 TaxID=2975990 RepID=UPI003FA5FA26